MALRAETPAAVTCAIKLGSINLVVECMPTVPLCWDWLVSPLWSPVPYADKVGPRVISRRPVTHYCRAGDAMIGMMGNARRLDMAALFTDASGCAAILHQSKTSE